MLHRLPNCQGDWSFSNGTLCCSSYIFLSWVDCMAHICKQNVCAPKDKRNRSKTHNHFRSWRNSRHCHKWALDRSWWSCNVVSHTTTHTVWLDGNNEHELGAILPFFPLNLKNLNVLEWTEKCTVTPTYMLHYMQNRWLCIQYGKSQERTDLRFKPTGVHWKNIWFSGASSETLHRSQKYLLTIGLWKYWICWAPSGHVW